MDGKLYGQKGEDYDIYYRYDEKGVPIGFWYSSYWQSLYQYAYNAQGDIIGILDGMGYTVASYSYDAWGVPTLVYDDIDNIGSINPLRYRGYYYDNETGFYYVSSRYYDPEIGRWINADSVISGVGGSIQGSNMFAYCMNNPVNMTDDSGHWPTCNQIKSNLKKAASSIGKFFSKLTKPIEAEIGFGQGIGLDISDTVKAEFSRDTYIRMDDNSSVLGNVITSEISLLDSSLKIGDTYDHKVEVNGKRISNSGKPTDGPFDMMNYPDVTHGNEFAVPFFAINSEGELLFSLSAGFHLGIGGHVSIAYNISELIEVFK